MAQYQILSWRGIPAQIRVLEQGKRPVTRQLPERFQIEIDRVAMREGLTGTDAYLEQWQWSQKTEREGSAEEVADALLRELTDSPAPRAD